jgi:hypothetical protein
MAVRSSASYKGRFLNPRRVLLAERTILPCTKRDALQTHPTGAEEIRSER